MPNRYIINQTQSKLNYSFGMYVLNAVVHDISIQRLLTLLHINYHTI